jgi:hypothetical protein
MPDLLATAAIGKNDARPELSKQQGVEPRALARSGLAAVHHYGYSFS